MPVCTKPNNDIVTPPRQPSAREIMAKQARPAPTPTQALRPVTPVVPAVQLALVKTSAEAKQAIRDLERLKTKRGVDTTAVDRELTRLRSRLTELEREERALAQLDPLFVTVPTPMRTAPDVDDTTEIASWASGATYSEIGALAEQAATRWAEQTLGMRSGTDAHHVNAHGIDHVFVDRNNNLFVAETKGTAGIGKTEQARYNANKPPGPKTLLSHGQFSDAWIEKDAWITEQGLTADAIAEKLFFRVDVTSQSIDVFGQDESGELTQRLGGPFHCETLDLLRAIRDTETIPATE